MRAEVDTVLGLLRDKLPAPIAGQIDGLLHGGGGAGAAAGGSGDMLGGAVQGLGDMFGKKDWLSSHNIALRHTALGLKTRATHT